MKEHNYAFQNADTRPCLQSRTQNMEKAKIVSSEHITNVTGHRGINFLNEYDEAKEQ